MAEKIAFDEEAIEDKIKELVKKINTLNRAHVDYQKNVAVLTQKREALRKEVAELEAKISASQNEASRILSSAKARGDAAYQEVVAKAKGLADEIVDEADKIKSLALDKQEEALGIMEDVQARAEEVAGEAQVLEGDKRILSEEREAVTETWAVINSVREEVKTEGARLNAWSKEQTVKFEDLASALSEKERVLSQREKEIDQKDKEVKDGLSKMSILHSEIVVLQSRLDASRKDVKAVEDREARVAQRELDVKNKLAKAEADLTLAHKKEQDASILNLQAHRMAAETRKKEEVLAKLNIPIK